MARFVLPGLFCFFMISCQSMQQDRGRRPETVFADGHIHAGFILKDGAVAANLVYFLQRNVKAFRLSLPLDNSKTTDLETRIAEEILALGKLPDVLST